MQGFRVSGRAVLDRRQLLLALEPEAPAGPVRAQNTHDNPPDCEEFASALMQGQMPCHPTRLPITMAEVRAMISGPAESPLQRASVVRCRASKVDAGVGKAQAKAGCQILSGPPFGSHRCLTKVIDVKQGHFRQGAADHWERARRQNGRCGVYGR